MIEYYEERLDITNNKIIQLEKDIAILQENMTEVIEQVKAMQTFLIKLAQNQAEITKRVSQWPYIAVSSRGLDDE